MRMDRRNTRYEPSRSGGRETRDWRDTQRGDDGRRDFGRREEFHEGYYESGFNGPSQPFGARDTRQRPASPDTERTRGRFTGKGPKGYTRSDERVLEDVHEALTQAGDVDASEIEASVTNGEVTLTGTVNSRQEKRAAEACVESISGVKDVHNQLRIVAEPPARNRSAGNTSGRSEKNKGKVGIS